jgi:glutamate racemase
MSLLAPVMTTTGSLRFAVVDFVVLNMTHFPAMRGILTRLFGNDVFV